MAFKLPLKADGVKLLDAEGRLILTASHWNDVANYDEACRLIKMVGGLLTGYGLDDEGNLKIKCGEAHFINGRGETEKLLKDYNATYLPENVGIKKRFDDELRKASVGNPNFVKGKRNPYYNRNGD